MSREAPPFPIAIQGGPGSFNDEAFRSQLDFPPDAADVRYLYTSEAVFRALAAGEVRSGQAALENTLGGPVEETVDALRRYPARELCRFQLRIAHSLMIPPGVRLEDVRAIWSHPQVLAQCRNSLARRFPGIALESGEGDARNTARAAELLAAGELGPAAAVVGSRRLAELHGLVVAAEDLQDSDDNFTTFGWFRSDGPGRGG